MKDDYEEARFDAFCRAVIKNEAKDAYREENRQAAKEISLDCLPSSHEIYGIEQEDDYSTYEKIYYVGDIKVVVHNESLGDVLQFLIPARRNVILLGYFMGYSDSEISQIMHISHTTVSYRRKVALTKIRELLEAYPYER